MIIVITPSIERFSASSYWIHNPKWTLIILENTKYRCRVVPGLVQHLSGTIHVLGVFHLHTLLHSYQPSAIAYVQNGHGNSWHCRETWSWPHRLKEKKRIFTLSVLLLKQKTFPHAQTSPRGHSHFLLFRSN